MGESTHSESLFRNQKGLLRARGSSPPEYLMRPFIPNFAKCYRQETTTALDTQRGTSPPVNSTPCA